MSNKDINIAQIENIFINATKSENIVNLLFYFHGDLLAWDK